jgi:hypothetical protein
VEITTEAASENHLAAATQFDRAILDPHEPSAWLRGQVARRVAYVKGAGLDPTGDTLIVAPLGRSAVPGGREDRTCERCRSYTPVGPPFHVFILPAARSLHLVGGLCAGCWAKEVTS